MVKFFRSPSSASIFELFSAGKHDMVCDRFVGEQVHEMSNSDRHLIFASHILTSRQPPVELVNALPQPLDRTELEARRLSDSLGPDGQAVRSVITQPRSFAKVLLAAKVGLQFK